MSTHCSGCGSAEMALDFIKVALWSAGVTVTACGFNLRLGLSSLAAAGERHCLNFLMLAGVRLLCKAFWGRGSSVSGCAPAARQCACADVARVYGPV